MIDKCTKRKSCAWGCVVNCSAFEEDVEQVRNYMLSKELSDNWLTIKEVATLYGEVVNFKWLSLYGDEWLDKSGPVNAQFLLEMERHTIKDVYHLV